MTPSLKLQLKHQDNQDNQFNQGLSKGIRERLILENKRHPK